AQVLGAWGCAEVKGALARLAPRALRIGTPLVLAERCRLTLAAAGKLLQFGPQGGDHRLQFAHLPLQRVDALLLLDGVQEPNLRQLAHSRYPTATHGQTQT